MIRSLREFSKKLMHVAVILPEINAIPVDFPYTRSMLTPKEYSDLTGCPYRTVMDWLYRGILIGAVKSIDPESGRRCFRIPPDALPPVLKPGPKPQAPLAFDPERARKLLKKLNTRLTKIEREDMEKEIAEYYLQLALTAEANLNGCDENAWLMRLHIEHDHLLAALDYFTVRPGYGDKEQRLLLLLVRYWDMSGQYPLAEPRLIHALDRHPGETEFKAMALARLGLITYRQGRLTSAKEYLAKSLAVARILDDKEALALALNVLGRAQRVEGALTLAKASFQEAILHAEAGHLQKRVGWALRGLGEVAEAESDWSASWDCHARSLEIAEALGNVREIAAQRDSLGALSQQAGDYEQAMMMYQQALALRLGAGNKNGIAQTYFRLGLLEMAQGERGRALVWLNQAVGIFTTIGSKVRLAEVREAVTRCEQMGEKA